MKTATKESNLKVVVAAKNKRNRRDYPPITINPERLGGTPTIFGTRLPVITLIDYLNDEASIEKFKEDFPGITDEQIQSVLETIRGALENGWLAQRVDY